MSNILVTGGLGFIGHNVVSHLEKLGHTVYVADTQTNYGIIPQDEISYLFAERKKKIQTHFIYKFDICHKRNMEWLFAGNRFDIVIHLASFPRQKVVNSNPALGSQVMSEGLLNLLEASSKYKVRKFVYISSSMVYGNFDSLVDEGYPCNPIGQYGIMKLAGEWLVKDYSKRDNIVHTIIRPSAVYGPLDVEDRVVSKFILQAMRDEPLNVNGVNESLDFTYVDDVVSGIVGATLSDKTENKTYNITKSQNHTLLEAAELAIKIVGKGRINITDRDINFPSRNALDIGAARRDFGYDPKIDIEIGFQQYYEWLKASKIYTKA